MSLSVQYTRSLKCVCFQDVYLYYFLKNYPGRTLVFTNSKDCIRRLVSIFTLLQCEPLPLHADMHQRQRLKNLDRFTGKTIVHVYATCTENINLITKKRDTYRKY